MRTALSAVVLLVPVLLSPGCAGRGAAGACDGVTCPAGQGCDTRTGACVSLQAMDACGLTCSGRTPACDGETGSCKVCTASAGCGGSTPVCNTAPALGACVQCTADGHCGTGQRCHLSTFSCVAAGNGGSPDAGALDAGAPGGGSTVSACSPACGGLTPRCEPASGLCVACIQDSDCGAGGQCDTSLFACVQGQCITPPPPPQATCATTCPEGFACQGGQCVLRGGSGPVQVTLRWDTDTDLDLHVFEPTSMGHCEISYSDPNQPAQGLPSSCGAVGSLDLDSNAGCALDHVNVENIIYPANQPAPSGTYTVQVENFDNCAVSGALPFEVTVRANGQLQVLCGSFPNNTAGANKTVLTFTVP